jgi:hypothetical protein
MRGRVGKKALFLRSSVHRTGPRAPPKAGFTFVPLRAKARPIG